VRDAGFENVVVKKFAMPIGSWARDGRLKKVGTYNMVQILDGLEGFSMRLLCDVGGWTEDAVHEILKGARKELKDPALHLRFDL